MTRWWRSIPFRRQVFLVVIATLGGSVTLAELLVDPIIDAIFPTAQDALEWEEWAVWLLCVLAVGAGLSSFHTWANRRRLARLARLAEEIGHGNFTARIVVDGHPDDHLSKLSQSFNAMAETIDSLARGERRLLADISHELRSPLARLSAAVELLRLTNADTPNTLYLDKIAGDLEQMRGLIAVLLEQGRIRLAASEKRETLDLSAAASDAADGLQMLGATQKKTLRAEIAPGLRVKAHPMQLRLIFENILENALLHTPVESRVDLRVRRIGAFARITVRDWGAGVPEEALALLFQPFFRVNPAGVRKSGGVGLGLTLVREACQALGGSISAKNAFPGLEMNVFLPLSTHDAS